jgi:dienelactone hydrolase
MHGVLLWTVTFLCYAATAQMSIAETNNPAADWLRSVQLAPEFVVPASREQWETDRQKIRTQLWQLLGKLPPRREKVAVRTVHREQRDGYILEKFTFDNGAGAEVPGYIFLPLKRTGKAPGILYCHWHGGQYDNGKEEMLKAEHTPEQPGPTLAKRGYVVLGIDAYCFGERNGKGPGGTEEKGGAGEMTASKFELWAGRSLWGMILRDDLLALDYLASRPEVDSKRLGVTGISMGATRSWWLMALDERIKAGVAVCCLTRYQNLIQHEGLKYHGIYYFVPGMLNHFDTEAIVAASAPRALLCLNGDRDEGSPVDGIQEIEKRAAPAWKLYETPQNFESLVYPNTGHEYKPEMWQKMLHWFNRHLENKPE